MTVNSPQSQPDQTKAAKQQAKENPGQAEDVREQQYTALATQILRGLGRPLDLERVQVRRLWEGHYRVNVFLGDNAASSRVAHSFFVVTDGDGTVVTSSPEITRHY